MLTVLLPAFRTAMSGLPSPLKSPTTASMGLVPTGYVVAGPKSTAREFVALINPARTKEAIVKNRRILNMADLLCRRKLPGNGAAVRYLKQITGGSPEGRVRFAGGFAEEENRAT